MLNLPKNFAFLRLRRGNHIKPQDDILQGKLAALTQILTIAERTAEASGVPFLKGAIGIVLVVADCVRGYQSNSSALKQLALRCAQLIVDITKRIESGPDISDDLKSLVEDLFKTLEEVQEFVKNQSSRNKIWRALTQQDVKEKISDLHRDLQAAHSRFQTLSIIVKDQMQAQDIIYRHGDIELGDSFADGNEWVAFMATLTSGKPVLVKRYTSKDLTKRKMMHIQDCKAFKERWYPNNISYMGRSDPREDYPYTVLKGGPAILAFAVTSDHVSIYIALQFHKDNHKGSIVALKLLRDLTNALAYTVGATDSSSFDISKVHLDDTGKLIIVDLEPSLKALRMSKNDMPYWRSWQEICIELLSGDPTYEPNPAIEDTKDPALHARLEYLRPILGHIHSGGLRFKDPIEAALKRQALMLSKSLAQLQGFQWNRGTLKITDSAIPTPTGGLLSAFWHDSRRNLHYVGHFREPLDVAAGDVGYITGNPPQFIRLENAYAEVSDGAPLPMDPISPVRFSPKDRWTTEVVDGITRHAFHFCDSDSTELTEWRTGRPRLDKDLKLGRVNIPSGQGLVVDCTLAWDWLAKNADSLTETLNKPGIGPSNLILVVYYKQQSGYATFRLNKKISYEEWFTVWAREGFDAPPDAVYFYESSPGGPNGTWGYFSFSPTPGSPHRNWTPSSDTAGESWGWTFVSEDWTVEISKPNIKQYIRYVQL